jgi:hypothetical protein
MYKGKYNIKDSFIVIKPRFIFLSYHFYCKCTKSNDTRLHYNKIDFFALSHSCFNSFTSGTQLMLILGSIVISTEFSIVRDVFINIFLNSSTGYCR